MNPTTPLAPTIPLAERMRPQSLGDVAGQQHLLDKGKPLHQLLTSGPLHSCILWGPPGVGKTTLGRLVAHVHSADFVPLSAVDAGIKDIRATAQQAQSAMRQSNRRTVVFVDEIHAFNKTQQDALLPHVESGLFTLIGSTTEHPGIQVTRALLSRCQVYELHSLEIQDCGALVHRARSYLPPFSLSPQAIELLFSFTDGDGRRFLNLLEQMVNSRLQQTSSPCKEAVIIDAEWIRYAASPALRRSDKSGDIYYEQMSALHKSLRSSQPDAALYWMARLLDGGIDPRHVMRRMICVASEDIGNADPRALQIAIDAAHALERLGLPEGELAMAQACTYLACAPKSNAAYHAWQQAKAFVKKGNSLPVPTHLRNATTNFMKEQGYGKAYRYAHDEPHAYPAGMSCWPDGLTPQNWYQPVARGLEIKIREKLAWLRQLDESNQ